MTRLVSQPEPEHIAHATLTLARVLGGGSHPETRYAALAALAILEDVHPPYPPQPECVEPIDPEAGIREALAALDRAAAEASTIPETLRIARAARELRQLADIDSGTGAGNDPAVSPAAGGRR